MSRRIRSEACRHAPAGFRDDSGRATRTSTCDLPCPRLVGGTKKTGLGNSSRPGSQSSPACLAIYLTWLQAGRLKSPRDKSCSIPSHSFRQGDHRITGKRPYFQRLMGPPRKDHPVSFTLSPGANGILPDRMIAAMADAGLILPAYPFVESQIQPASLDLRLGDIAYRVRASFLPGPGATVAERIDELKLHEIDLTDGAVLETNCVYIVPLLESLA